MRDADESDDAARESALRGAGAVGNRVLDRGMYSALGIDRGLKEAAGRAVRGLIAWMVVKKGPSGGVCGCVGVSRVAGLCSRSQCSRRKIWMIIHWRNE